MKDYILVVTDLALFRESIKDVESDLLIFDDDTGSVTIDIAKAAVHYNGNQSAAIIRTTPEHLMEVEALESVAIVGEAKVKFIKSDSDVNWINKPLYYEVFDEISKTYTDDFGDEHTYTPPKLHCVLAS